MLMPLIRPVALLVALGLSGIACADESDSSTNSAAPVATTVAVATTAPSTPTTAPTTTEPPTTSTLPVTFPPTTFVPSQEPELREELLLMFRTDQADRLGQPLPEGVDPMSDSQRTERLKDIIAEYGWPTIDLVGHDGAQAAWVIAQHSDLDKPFQKEALVLMKAAVDIGQADGSEYAYLQDRVLVGDGQPQIYGTQVGCVDGLPVAATPIVDPDTVDERRAAFGMQSLADYYAEMELICGED